MREKKRRRRRRRGAIAEDNMCVPCDDGVEQNHRMRKEETAILAKGVKRKGNTSAMFARRCFLVHPNWPYICVRTRTRNRLNVMFVIKLLVNLVV